MIKAKYFGFLTLLVYLVFFLSCSSKKDLENFVEFEKTETVFYNNELTIIYVNRNREDDELFLKVKYPSSDQEDIIFHGHCGHAIDKLFVDNVEQRLIYTLRDLRKNIFSQCSSSYNSSYYFIFYDLKTMEIVNKISIMDTIMKIKGEDFNYEKMALRSWIDIDEISNRFFFPIDDYSTPPTLHNGNWIHSNRREYIVFDIDTAQAEIIPFEEYKSYFQISRRASTYNYQDNEKTIFQLGYYTFPEENSSGFVPKYRGKGYKRKYYGVYINDGNQNIRISKLLYIGGYTSIFWLNDGQNVICGSYFFDTSGKFKEIKIVDGEILAIY